MGKASQAEMTIRLNQIIAFLLDGKSRHFITQFCAENWGIAQRQVDECIKQSWEIIREAGSESTQREKSRVLSNLWRLFREAAEAGDRREQHALTLSLAKILGLEIAPAEQPARLPSEISNEELAAGLTEEPLH